MTIKNLLYNIKIFNKLLSKLFINIMGKSNATHCILTPRNHVLWRNAKNYHLFF